ncbi:hypothetical protein GRI42_07695 [Erythrobacter gaetbuli]|uniref:Uncharacterized protein n=1 Tax=Qipengyuania gaetbuli TaxID=266952 RepID=A0A844XYW5_9SPHN|nr:lysylphosphatidylglycerol synthase domain-containing protein [Qipengyuania gaetbuli]MXO51185.1 hypothetical protein [Qipengyuania gaetbuli]
MSNSRRNLLAALSLAFAAALLVALFRFSGVAIADLVAALGTTPASVIAAVLALTLANQLVSVARWRVLDRFLGRSPTIVPWGVATRATLRGALAGQVLPLQFSMPLARWASVRNGQAVNATLYEQLLDLILLACAGAAAILLFAWGPGMAASLALFCAAVLVSVATMPWLLHILRAVTRTLPRSVFIERAGQALARAASLPARTLFLLGWLSALRLAMLSLRTVLVVAAFAGGIDAALVAIGYPAVGLAMGLPFLPAGMGVADWSLAALVVFAGGTATAAATAALALRALTFASLAVLVALFELAALIESDRAAGSAAPQFGRP